MKKSKIFDFIILKNVYLLQKNYFSSLRDVLPIFYDTISKWTESLGTNSGFYKLAGVSIIDNLIANIKPKGSVLSVDKI
jgi:hypothetical protein